MKNSYRFFVKYIHYSATILIMKCHLRFSKYDYIQAEVYFCALKHIMYSLGRVVHNLCDNTNFLLICRHFLV